MKNNFIKLLCILHNLKLQNYDSLHLFIRSHYTTYLNYLTSNIFHSTMKNLDKTIKKRCQGCGNILL